MRKNQGFTLLEATIAMVLLAIAAAGILLPFANATAVQAEGAKQTMAADLASELMEITLQKGYAVLAVGYSYSEAENLMEDAAGTLHTDSAYTDFSRDVVCNSYIDEGVYGKRLLIVTVNVYYDGVKVTSLTTLIGDH